MRGTATQRTVESDAPWPLARYRLHEELARGSMGVVYRAFDRLAQREVAVKRPFQGTGPLRRSAPPSSSAVKRTSELRDEELYQLALTREYRILASLRHPHIISVLDYGFDTQGQSYLVLELLDDALTLADASALYTLEQRILLLGQLMQALQYLHRAGVVHRDLKPENVLLIEEDGVPTVKLADFGLAVRKRDPNLESGLAGTMAYLAPEALKGASQSELTEIYSLGVVSFEVCANRHPFEHLNSSLEIATAARFGMANFKELPLNQSGRDLIAAMMSPKPLLRPQRMGEAFVRWCAANDMEVPSESLAIRNSVLRSARFVGREAELGALTKAVNEALEGRGSAWLVSGVSGMGKSRLLDEVKAAALVQGMLVLRGQALDVGGRSFAVWRDILRELALYLPLEPLEAAVLKGLVDDLDVLLETPIAMAAPLDRDGNLQRLAKVVEQVFNRLDVPVLVVMEDLHWASSESIALLRRAASGVGNRGMVIVGSTRSDERTSKLDELERVGVQELPLKPFEEKQIAALYAAIVGPQEVSPQSVEAVQNASDGSPFFVLELLRSLAEDHGSLHEAAGLLQNNTPLKDPSSLVGRRLERIPPRAREGLAIAAVAGRQLDLQLLDTLIVDLPHWLRQCALANVLEVMEDRWRFSHDKLREKLLKQMDAGEKRKLHADIADAMQSLHGAAASSSMMAFHRQAAGQYAEALTHLLDASEKALEHGAFSWAQQFAESALEHAQQLPGTQLDRARARLVLVNSSYALAQPEQSLHHAHSLLTEVGLISIHSEQPKLALLKDVLNALHYSPYKLGSIDHDDEIWPLVFQAVKTLLRVRILSGNNNTAFHLLVVSNNLGRSIGHTVKTAMVRCALAYTISLTPMRALAWPLLTMASRLIEEQGDEKNRAQMHEIHGVMSINRGRWRQASHHFREMATLATSIGDEHNLVMARLHGSLALEARGDLAAANVVLDEAGRYTSAYDDSRISSQFFNRNGWLSLHRGEVGEAVQQCFQSALDEKPPYLIRVSALAGLAAVQWLENNNAAAEHSALAALEMTTAHRLTGHAGVFSLPNIALILLDTHRRRPTPARRQSALAAVQSLKQFSSVFPMAQPGYWLASSYFQYLKGDMRRARRQSEKSIEAAQRLTMPLDQAMATIALAQRSPRNTSVQCRASNMRHDLRRRGALGCLMIIGKLAE